MMKAKSYTINSREGEKVSFDIDAVEFQVTVLQADKDCTIIDNVHGRMYMTQAETAKAAVVAYVNWLFGMMNEWVADPDEFGCYEMTAHKIWMSECCDIVETLDCYEVVES